MTTTAEPESISLRPDVPLERLPDLLNRRRRVGFDRRATQPRCVAVAEPARAITLAALVELTDRRPIVVAVPTSAEAERLAHDLALFVGAGRRGSVPGLGDAAL